MTWKTLSVWLLVGYAAFSAASLIWPSGIEPLPNASAAQTVVMFLVAFLTVYLMAVSPLFLLALLVARVPPKNRKRPLPQFLFGALIAAIPVLVALVYYSHYAYTASRSAQLFDTPTAANTPQGTETAQANLTTHTPTKMTVTVTSQSAQGVTEQDMDGASLKNLEAWIVQRTEANIRKAYAANGLPDRDPQIYSEATYIEASGRKLAVVRVLVDETISQVTVAGFVDDEMKRVGCVQESPERIPIAFGECADKVKAVFGVQLGR